MSIKTKRRWIDLGASLVEYGLLVALIAVIAIPAVRRLGAVNACNYCHLRYCQEVDDWYYCAGPGAHDEFKVNCPDAGGPEAIWGTWCTDPW